MTENKRRIGSKYEREAGIFLEKQGYQVLEYNYRCRTGEIDLIAKENECLVFCEVKYRADNRNGSPLEAVGEQKRKRIFRCALHYLATKGGWEMPCRFDVVGITGEEFCLVKNAFSMEIQEGGGYV